MAILHMADTPAGEWATAKGIAQRYAIPPELLGKVLQSLARSSLVESMPGVNGGYRLRAPLGKLNLGNIIDAVEGPVQLVDCQENPERCSQYNSCIIKEPVQFIHAQLVEYIHNISLEQFRPPAALEKTP